MVSTIDPAPPYLDAYDPGEEMDAVQIDPDAYREAGMLPDAGQSSCADEHVTPTGLVDDPAELEEARSCTARRRRA